MTEINTLGVSTPTAEPEAVESPEVGHDETVESEVVEHAETGTDNAVEEFTPERYKELQSKFTKTAQEKAEIERIRSKEAEELATFRKMYAEQPKQQPQKSAKEFAEMSEMEKFNYLVGEQVNSIVNPYIQEIQQLKGTLNSIVNENAAKMRDSFLQSNPDAVQYENDIAKIMIQHNIGSPQKAWNFLKTELGLTKNEAKQEVIKEIQVKKDASKLMKPVSTPSTPINTKVSSFEEAYEKALKETGSK